MVREQSVKHSVASEHQTMSGIGETPGPGKMQGTGILNEEWGGWVEGSGPDGGLDGLSDTLELCVEMISV